MFEKWTTAKLQTITTKIGSGSTPRGGKTAYKSSGITLIRSLNVYDFAFDYQGLAFIDEQQAKDLANVELQPNDILLNITGASVARCCIVPVHLLPARVNQHVAIVRVDPAMADPFYVLYFINSPQNKSRLLALAQGGATREALTKTTIENFEITLPSLSIQRKIGEILSGYDRLIENNTRRIFTLEQIIHNIYQEWFIFLRSPKHEQDIPVNSSTGYKTIPNGWRLTPLREICNYINRGISPKYDDNAECIVINQKCIRNGRIDLSLTRRNAKIVPLDKHVRYGDILVNSTGEGTLGRVAQVYTEVSNYTVDSHVSIVRPSDPSFIDYLGITLIDKQNDIARMGEGSTNQTELTRDRLGNLEVLVPPQELAVQFSEVISPLRKQALVLESKNSILANARDLLLPRLISGELDVSALNIVAEQAEG